MSPQLDHPTALPHKRVRFEPKASPKPAMSNEAAASGHTSDSDSELSESSEEPSSESSSEDDTEGEDNDDTMPDAGQKRRQANKGVVNLRAGQGQKPIMKLDKNELGPDIRIFLKDFLPQLKAANEELAAQRRAGTLKHREIDMVDVDDNEQYIEMVSGVLRTWHEKSLCNLTAAPGSWTWRTGGERAQQSEQHRHG
jgi:U3 small nucleolar RNA-associated protein 14